MARHEEYSTDPQGHEAADRLPAWLEWKARCARGLCTAAHQSALADFAGGRFSTYVQRYAASTGIREAGQITALYPPEDAWHLFETHLCARSAPGGKHYKDWIFARPTAGRHTVLQAIEAGASLVVRDVVRDRLRSDYAPASCLSIEVEIFANERDIPTAPTVFLACPDPLDETAAREYEELARRHAEQAFETMTVRERITVLSRELGLTFSDPAVGRAAGCHKSALYHAYQGFFVRMAQWMRETYPDDDTESVMALTLMLIRSTNDHLEAWAREAECCASLRGALETS